MNVMQDNGNSPADSITLGQLRAMVGTAPKPKVFSNVTVEEVDD